MLKVFKWVIRSKTRDDDTDTQRFQRMIDVLEEVSTQTALEYDGLVKRMRELSSRSVNETVYAIVPPTEEKLAASSEDVSRQLDYAVARTQRLVEQLKCQKAAIEALRAARANGVL